MIDDPRLSDSQKNAMIELLQMAGYRAVQVARIPHRALIASDALAYTKLFDQQYKFWLSKYYYGKGLRGKDLDNMVQATANDDEYNVIKTKEVLKSEGLQEGTKEYAKRYRQVLDSMPTSEDTEDAKSYARKQAEESANTSILFGRPVGVSGHISDLLNRALTKVPALRLVQPVVNVGGNLWNIGLRNTPYLGILYAGRAAKGFLGQTIEGLRSGKFDYENKGSWHYLTENYDPKTRVTSPLAESQVNDRWKAFVTSSVVMAALALWAANSGGDDDDYPITGTTTGDKEIGRAHV